MKARIICLNINKTDIFLKASWNMIIDYKQEKDQKGSNVKFSLNTKETK